MFYSVRVGIQRRLTLTASAHGWCAPAQIVCGRSRQRAPVHEESRAIPRRIGRVKSLLRTSWDGYTPPDVPDPSGQKEKLCVRL